MKRHDRGRRNWAKVKRGKPMRTDGMHVHCWDLDRRCSGDRACVCPCTGCYFRRALYVEKV